VPVAVVAFVAGDQDLPVGIADARADMPGDEFMPAENVRSSTLKLTVGAVR
jgi:hypothetical protein